MRLRELEDWLTPTEAGRVIGISKQAAFKRLEEGTMRGVRTHQGWLVDPADAGRVAAERRERAEMSSVRAASRPPSPQRKGKGENDG